jgi:hypothetical protein
MSKFNICQEKFINLSNRRAAIDKDQPPADATDD